MVFTKDENDISQYILQELYYIVSELIVEKRNIGYHPDTNTEYENSDYIIMRCSKEWRGISGRAMLLSKKKEMVFIY